MPVKEHPSAPTASSSPDLPRVLGLVSIIGIIIGTMIGSGIFINPPNVAKAVGTPELILAVWIVGGLLSLFGALSLAELGAIYTEAGGTYIYLREAYGTAVAFLFGWSLFIVIESGTVATLAVGFATKYLPYFVELTPLQAKLVAFALIAVLAAVNVTGTRRGAGLMNFLTAVKFIALIGMCVLVVVFAKGETKHFLSPAGPAGPAAGLIGNFGVALVAVLWAYKGWESSSYSVGEIRNPQKKLPVGLLIGTSVVVLLYIAANLVYLYVFPAAEMAASRHIAADVMQAAVGPVGASIIAVIILMSITGTCNGHLLTAPRVVYAMSKDGFFFKSLAAVHPRYRTPHKAIIALAAWGGLLCATGSFEQLYTFAMFGYWIFMGLAVAGVIILRKKRPDLPRPYKVWGYPVTPILFISGMAFLTVNSLVKSFWNAFAGLGLIALGLPVYYFWKSRKTRVRA